MVGRKSQNQELLAGFDLVRHFDEYGHLTWPWLLVGPPSAPILAAAGALFLLRRVCLRIAIIVSVLVLLAGRGYIFLFVLMV